MQTIKVNTNKTEYGVAFSIQDGNFLAAVGTDFYNKGRYTGQFGPYGSCNNCTFAEAIEKVSNYIENHFAAFGLNVEFV